MRTHLFRGVMALAVLLTVSAVPALAQSVVRGKVVDGQGKPVPDATVLFEATDANRKTQTKTDKNGDFLQVGLSSGSYKVTASKDGVGSQTLNSNVRQGPNNPMSFTLSTAAAGGGSAADKEAAAALQAAAGAAIEAMKAGRHDEAIAKFNEVIAKMPTCADCYYNVGTAYVAKQDYAQAETAFKKMVQLSGGAAGGGGAEASYNQGVILFNSGKFAEAKTQFEAATKADPNMGMAHYQLGMTALNLGQIPEAVAALEAYLKVEPNGSKAGEVKAALPALQTMLKK
jgi:tetratricopeptide (TPR) repeat protein